MIRFKTLILCLVLFSAGPSFAEGGLIEYEKGEKVKVAPSSLHPTQFLFSQMEVDAKVKELEEVMNEEDEDGVKEFLKEHRGKVIVGPNNNFWLVDGHHHARALQILRKIDQRFKEVPFYAKILHEWNELSPKEFEKAMQLGNKHGESGGAPYVYLKDGRGRLQSFKKLPRKLSSMKDSPFRSLVWMLKEAEAIVEVEEIPYQEFIVAEYLQKHIHLPSKMSKTAYQKAFDEALQLIQEAEEGAFPGYKKLSDSFCAKIMKRIQTSPQ